MLGDAALEDIGVLAVVGTGRLGLRQLEQRAEFGQEQLQVGAFIAAVALAAAPTREEGVDLGFDVGLRTQVIHD